MKLACLAGLALACSTSFADEYTDQVPLIVPKCGNPTITPIYADGPYPIAIRQTSHCNSSGRGAHVRYYAACVYPFWDEQGVLLEYEIGMWPVLTDTKPIALSC